VFNSRSDRRSAFVDVFSNHWVWAAIGLSLVLQVVVLYVPPMQKAFGTVGLSASDWLRCLAAASVVLWMREISKLFLRRTQRAGPPGQLSKAQLF
jgi:Ca2+-transporting ATPase